MAVPGYIFGEGQPYKSAAELDRERALVDVLLNRYSAPRTPGQGLTAIGNAIAARRARSRLSDDEKASKGAGAALAAQLSGMYGSEVPATGPDADPEYPQAEPSAAVQPSFGKSLLSKLQPEQTPAVDAELAYDPSQPALPPSPAVGDPVIDPAQAQPIPQPIAAPQPTAPAPQQNGKLQSLMKIAADPAFEHMPPAAQEIVRKQLEQEVLANDPMRQLQMQKIQQDIASGKYKEIGGKLIDMETFQPVYAPPPGEDGAEYGLNPIVTQDAEGKYHLFQASKAGGPPKEIQLPYGWTPQQQFLDTGTGFQAVPKVGVGGGAVIPKDVAGEAALKVEGKETGEAAALYSSLSSKIPGLKKVVGDLKGLADQATYTKSGQAYNEIRKQLGYEPTEAAIARTAYQAMVDNQVLPMLRDTFGAQFTVAEGASLRATLGDPDKTPAEKKAVLDAFIDQKARNIEAAAQQGKVAVPSPSGGGKPADWTDEEWNALTPEEKARFGQ